MRVALTGCEGILGSEIAKSSSLDTSIELVQNDFDIARGESGDEAEGNYIFGDLRRGDTCVILLAEADVLVHMAQSNNPMLADSD